MDNIKNWFDIIINNKIRAFNSTINTGLVLCFNFIQVPDTETVVMTVTVMKNKIKKNSLDPMSFVRVMKCIEDSLDKTSEEFAVEHKECILSEHFKNIKSRMSTQWYIKLCCHRVFFIPEKALWETVGNLFNQDQVRTLKNNGIAEVSVLVNTENYDFKAKFY